jgi:hypothetical protein
MRLATIFAAILLSAVSAFAADVAGDWTLNIDSPQGPVEATLTLKQDGEKLTGTLSSQMGDTPITGTIKENDISLKMSIDANGQSMSIAYTAKVADKKMEGSLDLGGQGSIKFTGTKKA